MEGRAKVTKEVLCEEARFILANVMAEARYGRQNRYEDIRRVCEGAVSIPFQEYITFLEKAGYLRQDRGSDSLEVTPEGELVVNGGNLADFTERAVSHFKKLRQSRSAPSAMLGTNSGVVASTLGSQTSGSVSSRLPESRRESVKVQTSGGRSSAMVGGEIQSMSSEMIDSRYEKLAVIGSGGIGTVYRARQVPLNREVALKEIRDLFGFFSEDQRGEIVRRFTDVVRAAANLAHPDILPIHDVNLDREFPYMVVELAPNGSARRLINDAEEIPVALALKYLLQTLHALRAAHQQRVYHRGLKPEQLLIDAFGNVKVSDFGFTRIVERDHAVIRQVYVGMGNVAYMAPELYTDAVAAGAQADIYALGIIFYELLTRKLPGRRSPMPSQINAALPHGIDDIFDRMTRDSRAERYTSVDDILDDIDKLEGLGEILDQQTQVLVQENPLAHIKFREGAEDPLPPVEEESDAGSKAPQHRPYSFQQRKKKT
ncbi:MAG: serine/threonine protein kinase [Kofleriaceae bacterium]|nr:serine/threonine protein kinase [Myxococcales bacterium]MCB9564853.1 serine/threonine protein kinase [Kofleriaceae bacterium]MCB9574145.1 serine/threonine protein kinase [Kofleriaceae bacterium]